MSQEFTPTGRGAKMTKAQVRKYIREMKEKRAIARKKLAEYELSGEREKEQAEVANLEKKIDTIQNTDNNTNMITNTSKWEIVSVDIFLETYDLYKTFLGFRIGAPKMQSLFINEPNLTLRHTVENYLDEHREEKGMIRSILLSEEYPNYIYIQTDGEYLIKIQ